MGLRIRLVVAVGSRPPAYPREVNILANIKSAKKRIAVIAKRQLRNKMIKSSTKTAIKKMNVAALVGEKEATQAAFVNAVSAIDKATSKGVYHKNTASRKKSQLAKLLNKTNA
jgi:small subunit ribosomal protein S20